METIVELPEIEYFDGVGYAKMSPKYDHGLVQGAFVEVLRRLGRGFGTVIPELRCRLGVVDGTHTEFLPDVAFVSSAQRGALAYDQLQEPSFGPYIVVEVRSPSDRPGLRNSKIARYLATGSVLVLDVDPATRTIVAHAAEGVRSYAASERFEHATAPWLVFDASYVFEDLED